MSKFLDLIEENTPQDIDESTKESIEQLEGYMAQVELNLGYAGELLADLNDPIVEKRAGELGAVIQEDLHNFMDNFGGTSVEDNDVDPEEVPAEDFEFIANGRQKRADKFNKNKDTFSSSLDMAAKYIAADPNPQRPSRGVKKVIKSVEAAGSAIASQVKNSTKMIK